MKRTWAARGLIAVALLSTSGLVQQGHWGEGVHAAHARLGAANTLVIAEKEQPKSFDPLDTDDSTVNRMTEVAYDALLQYKAGTARLVPDLATAYTVSPDGMSYTFTLRQGVKFHSGSSFTATDVKFTLDRIKQLNQGIAFVLGAYKSTDVLGPYKVRINLGVPSAPFLAAIPKFYMLSKQDVMAHVSGTDMGRAWLKTNEDGTGPFQLVTFTPEQTAVFQRFGGYWAGPAKLDGVIYQFVKESATQELMLKHGDVDIADEPALADLPALSKASGIKINAAQTLVEFFLELRTTRKPLNNPLVRQAIAYAYDYGAHLHNTLRGYGVQAQGPFSSNIPFHDNTLPRYHLDLARAKALLTKAGYPKGGFTLRMAYLPVLDEESQALLNLQSNLSKLGITVQPVGMTFPTQAGDIQNPNSDIDIYAIYTFPPVADPDAALVGTFDCAARTSGYNGAAYCNPAVDAALAKARATTDKTVRGQLYKQIQRQLVTDVPALYVSNPQWVVAERSWVQGYKYTPSQHETQNVYDISLVGKKGNG